MVTIPVLSIAVGVIAFLAWLVTELRDTHRVIRVVCGSLVFLAMCGGVAESAVYAGVRDGKARVYLIYSVDQCIYDIEENETEQLLADLKRYRQGMSSSRRSVYERLADLHSALVGESQP